MKTKIDKLIKILKDFIDKSKVVFFENQLIFYYVFGAVLNGLLLRLLTTGNIFSISPLLADFSITFAFASFYFFLGEKSKNIYLIIAMLISFLVCIVNVVYYNYFDSFISITFVSFALTNHDTGGADVVGNLIELKYFLLIIYPIFMIIINRQINKKQKAIKKAITISKKAVLGVVYSWALVFLLLFISTLRGVDYARLYSQWNREYLVSKFGVYVYQINDIIKSIEPKMAVMFGSDKAIKEVNEFYKDISDVAKKNKYTDIFKGKNVITIHAESIQDAVINLKFNGKEVSPTLNKLASEGIYFSNFYPQVSLGTSSDTEFTLATSLLPVNSGTVFINYYDRKYITGYNQLADLGYYTFSMHGNTGDFWNRNIMHKNLGYQKFYEKSSYDVTEKIGFGISDKEFLTQSVSIIEEIAKQYEKYYGTLITLSNHTPFDEVEKYGDFDVSMTVKGQSYPYMEGTKLGNYFKSTHYADAQIGMFIDELDKKGLLDNTVIVIYGDHDARLSKSDWERLYNYDYTTNGILNENDENYQELDYYWYELNRNVPAIIWTKDKEFQKTYAAEIKTAMGMADLMPTLGNMLGFYNKYALGNDIMSLKDNLVIFPNGNFLTNNVYYSDSSSEYKLLKNVALDKTYVDEMKKKTDKYLKISNNIVVYDYFKKELSKEEYEVEE